MMNSTGRCLIKFLATLENIGVSEKSFLKEGPSGFHSYVDYSGLIKIKNKQILNSFYNKAMANIGDGFVEIKEHDK